MRTELLNQSICVAGLLLCVLGLIQLCSIGKLDHRERRCFIWYYVCLFLFVAANLVGQLLRGQPGAAIRRALLVSNLCEFLFSGILAYIGARYLLALTDPERRLRWLRIVFPALLAVHVGLLIVTQFTGLLYTIDGQNVYHRAAFYPLSLAGPAGILLGIAFLLLRSWKGLSSSQRTAFTVYLVLPLAAMAAQLLIYGVYLIVLAAVLSVLAIHVFLFADQRDRYIRQVREGEMLKINLMLSQIQPHFLYNSLGVIQSLCRKEPETAEQALGDFAEFLRHNIRSLEADSPILFRQELSHTQHYLALQKLRFGSDLNVVYNLECETFSLPTLTLQPLVENAVTHGIRQTASGRGTVTIRSREMEDHYEVSVIDDGVGFDAAAEQSGSGTHVALRNVRARLARVSGGSLRIVSVPGGGTTVTILIPKASASESHQTSSERGFSRRRSP